MLCVILSLSLCHHLYQHPVHLIAEWNQLLESELIVAKSKDPVDFEVIVFMQVDNLFVLIVFRAWVGFEADQDLNHCQVFVLHCEVQGRPAGQILMVDPCKFLQ